MAIRAEAAASFIGDLYHRTHALADMAAALARTGHRKQAAPIANRAENMARSITDPDEQSAALARAVWSLAETGQYRRAVAVAHAITNPNSQAEGLAELAVVLAKAGDNRNAARLTAAACAAGRWLCAAEPVFLLTRDVSEILARALEEI
jgi:hypothetical protein